MEAPDAQRIFQTNSYKAMVSRGPVVALLIIGDGVQAACSKVSVLFCCILNLHSLKNIYSYNLNFFIIFNKIKNKSIIRLVTFVYKCFIMCTEKNCLI